MPKLSTKPVRAARETDPADEYYTTPEAAHFIKMSEAYLERARWAGNGPPYIKLDRAVLYKRKTLADWLDARERTSTT